MGMNPLEGLTKSGRIIVVVVMIIVPLLFGIGFGMGIWFGKDSIENILASAFLLALTIAFTLFLVFLLPKLYRDK